MQHIHSSFCKNDTCEAFTHCMLSGEMPAASLTLPSNHSYWSPLLLFCLKVPSILAKIEPNITICPLVGWQIDYETKKKKICFEGNVTAVGKVLITAIHFWKIVHVYCLLTKTGSWLKYLPLKLNAIIAPCSVGLLIRFIWTTNQGVF